MDVTSQLKILYASILPLIGRGVKMFSIFESLHGKTNKMTFAPSKDSDQPRCQPSLKRVFAVHSMGS